ncbi:hypothetical protein TNCV_4041251 [Trichonephila clavipes]|nr:hypothetical protein TNCV_4041251 [Trichonephila clavipes]
MSAIADFKKMEVGKTFGTGLPAPSEEPPRLNFAQNERCSLRYWPACSVPIGREVAPHAILYQTLSEYLGKQLRLISGREILSLCTPPPAEAGVMWRVLLGSRVVGELKCRYR